MAKSNDTVRTALCAGGVGLLAGLLIIFIGVVNVITRAKPEALEPTGLQVSDAGFLGVTRGDYIHKKMEGNQVLGRIAMVQSRTGDLETTVAKIQADKLTPDLVRNQGVYNYLEHRVGPTDKGSPADYEAALKLARSIQNPLFKADALRAVAEYQLRGYPDEGKKTLNEAVTALGAPVAPELEPPPPLFRPITLLWPVGLAIFAILFALCLKPLLAGLMPAGRGKAAAEEEDEEEDEEEAKAAEAVPAEAMPAEAIA